jgi:hypothetical protein
VGGACVFYEKPRGTGECRVRRVHHTSASRATFMVGIHDATHQALMVLHHQESAILCHTQYCQILLKEKDGSDVRVNDMVHNDPTRRLGEQVRASAPDHGYGSCTN